MYKKVLPSHRLFKRFEERIITGDIGLHEVVQMGAQMMLQHAVELEMSTFLDRQYYVNNPEKTATRGRRNGYEKRTVLTGEGTLEIDMPQVRDLPEDGKMVPFVSDYFDFSIYIDADEEQIHDWYVTRFMRLRQTAFRDPKSFFHRYSELSEDAALGIAEGLWTNINLKNLKENIQPTRPRADLILKKGANHLVEEVLLRKL